MKMSSASLTTARYLMSQSYKLLRDSLLLTAQSSDLRAYVTTTSYSPLLSDKEGK